MDNDGENRIALQLAEATIRLRPLKTLKEGGRGRFADLNPYIMADQLMKVRQGGDRQQGMTG